MSVQGVNTFWFDCTYIFFINMLIVFYKSITISLYKNMKIFLSILSTVVSLFIKGITHSAISPLFFFSPSLTCPAAFDYKQLLFTGPLPSQTNLTVCSHGWMGRTLKRM